MRTLITKEELATVIKKHLKAWDESTSIHEKITQDLNKSLQDGRLVLIQTIKEDTKGYFNLKRIPNWTHEQKSHLDMIYRDHKIDDDIPVTINAIDGFHGLGDRNTEFYEIEFENGSVLNSICGWHLETEEEYKTRLDAPNRN